jgi:antitoxin YefM
MKEAKMYLTTPTVLRKNMFKIIDEACDTVAPLIVTRANGRHVVMISLGEFRGVEETLPLLSAPANAVRLTQSIAELNACNSGDPKALEPEI